MDPPHKAFLNEYLLAQVSCKWNFEKLHAPYILQQSE
jgi:hypothetical protein